MEGCTLPRGWVLALSGTAGSPRSWAVTEMSEEAPEGEGHGFAVPQSWSGLADKWPWILPTVPQINQNKNKGAKLEVLILRETPRCFPNTDDVCLFIFSDRVSLCGSGCLGAPYVDQAGFTLSEIYLPLCAGLVLRLKAHDTTSSQHVFFS